MPYTFRLSTITDGWDCPLEGLVCQKRLDLSLAPSLGEGAGVRISEGMPTPRSGLKISQLHSKQPHNAGVGLVWQINEDKLVFQNS